MRLFWEKGYNSTSIADVLQTAKVNSGSLYHFFPGKTDLLAAVLDMYHDGIRTMLLEPAWEGVADPIDTSDYSSSASIAVSRGDIYTSTSGQTANKGSAVFTPGYTYTLDAASSVQAEVQSGAGPK